MRSTTRVLQNKQGDTRKRGNWIDDLAERLFFPDLPTFHRDYFVLSSRRRKRVFRCEFHTQRERDFRNDLIAIIPTIRIQESLFFTTYKTKGSGILVLYYVHITQF